MNTPKTTLTKSVDLQGSPKRWGTGGRRFAIAAGLLLALAIPASVSAFDPGPVQRGGRPCVTYIAPGWAPGDRWGPGPQDVIPPLCSRVVFTPEPAVVTAPAVEPPVVIVLPDTSTDPRAGRSPRFAS